MTSDFSLPDNCSFEQAALAEPLSVLIHASRRANVSPGQNILVLGVGAIGILACALAKSLGAAHIVAIDINQDRLEFAKANGFATETYCPPNVDKAKTNEEQLRRAKINMDMALKHFAVPDGFDIVFECSGADSCIQMAIHVSSILHSEFFRC
jgi:L-iditol 2-dehydrogenase